MSHQGPVARRSPRPQGRISNQSCFFVTSGNIMPSRRFFPRQVGTLAFGRFPVDRDLLIARMPRPSSGLGNLEIEGVSTPSQLPSLLEIG
jgi:hypothetical protein